MNRKLILESVLFLLLGIFTVEKSVACYTHLLDISSPVFFQENLLVAEEPNVVTPKVIKCIQSDVLYARFDKNRVIKYHVFAQEEMNLLMVAAKKMSTQQFESLLDNCFVMGKPEFIKLVKSATQEEIIIARK